MSHIVEIIITTASIITALGVIFGILFALFKWLMKRDKNDAEIKEIKEEQSILTKGVLACLKGLKEQGCDGPVTVAIAEIEDHLSKLKSQETALLVEKVKKDMTDAGFDLTPLSFNSIGTELEGDSQNPDNIILENAVKCYGDCENKYELPIFCHDASKRPSGKRGFMITPEHLYTGARTSTASYKIGNLGNFSVKKKRIKQSLVLDTASDGEITLPCSYKNEELEKFASSLNSFVGYLKERPESRSIDYMLQTEHESIICMRCGAKFNDENICPECGMLGGKVDY